MDQIQLDYIKNYIDPKIAERFEEYAKLQPQDCDSFIELLSFTNSSNAAWAAQARAATAWRDETWTAYYAIIADWNANGTAPDWDVMEAQLPEPPDIT
jgi:hypothetical protein